MGLLVGTLRRDKFIKELSDIEWQKNLIQDSLTNTRQAYDDLIRPGTKYDPDSEQGKMLKEREYKFKVLEDQLNQQMTQLETRQKQVEKMLESANQEINSSMDRFYGGK